MEDLARQLAVVADEADDIIDFHVVNQLRERSQDKTRHMAALSSFCQDIEKIIKRIDSITEKLMMVKEERVDIQEQQPIVSGIWVLPHLLPVTRILWWDLMNACFRSWMSLLEMNLIFGSSQSSGWEALVFKSIHDESDVTSPLHTKLRCLKVKGYNRIEKNQKHIVPGTISLLWNLQILDLGHSKTVSLSEVWEMPKLRRLSINSSLPDVLEGQDSTILENLSTLSSSRGFSCSEEIVKRIPNLKKLYVVWPVSLDKLALFNKLESFSLKYNFCRLEDIDFPTSLKKLSLSRCLFPWEKMTIIGSSLPNLEVLKLNNAFKGREWNPVEGEFLRLKVLSIKNHDLEQWGAEDIHFPNLHGLYLEEMFELKDIPLSIGDIYTLHSIHFQNCGEFAMNSALEIVKDQKEKGNESLQVYVNGKPVDEEQGFSDSDLSFVDSDEEQS
ncbi:UNVERIFIED_CONTAM: hypothetical protein Sangu_2001000 [Sesamum angustifolium]|uniref:Uncharacterized protein n=1 Tax=Sesamum angustifolium TaxID=2727405 RepID=A0AAW2LI67_9LAMI